MLPTVPGVALVQNTPGAITITGVVRLNGKWGIEYNLLAVTQPAPSDLYLYTSTIPDLPTYTEVNRATYTGDIQFTLNGSAQSGFQMMTTADLSSPGTLLAARARSTVTLDYSDYSANFSIQAQPASTFAPFDIIDTGIAYGTNPAWTGSKWYVFMNFNYLNLSATDITNTRGRGLYAEGAYSVVGSGSFTTLPSFSDAFIGASTLITPTDGAIFIPLTSTASPDVDEANIDLYYGFYPAFDTEPEYNIMFASYSGIV